MEAGKVTGEITEAKMKLLKKQHGKVETVEVEMGENIGEDVALGYFKRPDLRIFSICMGFVDIKADGAFKITDYERFTNIIIENCWLDGDPRIKEDGMAGFSAASRLFALLKPKVARLKNG